MEGRGKILGCGESKRRMMKEEGKQVGQMGILEVGH